MLNIVLCQLSSSKDIQIKRINWTLQVAGRKVELRSTVLQESRIVRRDEVSSRGGGKDCLDHHKIHNFLHRLDTKWKGNKLPFFT